MSHHLQCRHAQFSKVPSFIGHPRGVLGFHPIHQPPHPTWERFSWSRHRAPWSVLVPESSHATPQRPWAVHLPRAPPTPTPPRNGETRGCQPSQSTRLRPACPTPTGGSQPRGRHLNNIPGFTTTIYSPPAAWLRRLESPLWQLALRADYRASRPRMPANTETKVVTLVSHFPKATRRAIHQC